MKITRISESGSFSKISEMAHKCNGISDIARYPDEISYLGSINLIVEFPLILGPDFSKSLSVKNYFKEDGTFTREYWERLISIDEIAMSNTVANLSYICEHGINRYVDDMDLEDILLD